MVDKILFRPEAEKDLASAFAWYEAQRKDLGHDFLRQVEAALHTIATNPSIAAPVYREIRIKLIRRFPYKILYLLRERTVVVLGIVHSRRHPTKFMNRT